MDNVGSSQTETLRQAVDEDEAKRVKGGKWNELRSVKSHPSMAHVDRVELAKTKTSLRDISQEVLLASRPPSASRSGSSSRDKCNSDRSSSQSTLKGPKSSRDDKAPPNSAEEEEEGGHDTITSLAGAKMLQKYRRTISGGGSLSSSRPGSAISNNQARLEALFRGESLEGIKESDDDGDEDEEDGKKKFLLQKRRKTVAASTQKLPDEEFVPPDGGYGWFVALGAFIALFWCAGMIKSYGVLFEQILVTFPEASKSLVSSLPACMTSMALLFAPVTSALCQHYTCRAVTLAGGLMCSLGFALSSIAPNVYYLFASLGVLAGVGVGLSTTPGVILTARYFDRNRAKANAFCLSGTAAGSFTLPFLIETLLATYGLRGTVLVLAGGMLHMCVSAALYRPMAVHVSIVNSEKKKVSSMAAAANKALLKDVKNTAELTLKASGLLHHDPRDPLHGHAADPKVLRSRLNSLVGASTSHDCIEKDATSSTSSLSHQHHHHHALQREGSSPKCPSCSSSIASFPFSLPPLHLEPCSFHGSSNMSVVSQENIRPLAESNCSTNSGGNSASLFRQLSYRNSDVHLTVSRVGGVQQAKALSMREIYMHQLGSRVNLYKSYLFGGSKRGSRRSNDLKGESDKTIATNAAKEKVKNTGYSTNLMRLKKKFSSSLIFSMEDVTTDSTCVMKDSRRPSVSRQAAAEVRRMSRPQLDRTLSDAHQESRSQLPRARIRRARYYSEGHHEEEPYNNSRFHLSVPEDVQEEDAEAIEKEEQEQSDSDSRAKKSDRLSRMLSYLDLALTKNPAFLVVTSSVMCMACGVPHLLFFLPSYVKSLPSAAADPAVLLAASSVCDLFGRLAAGVVLDMRLVPSHALFSSAMACAGAAALSLPWAESSTATLCALAGMYGLGSGVWFLMVPLLLSEHLGVERIAAAYGLVRFFQAGANLSGPLVGGQLWELTGDLDATFCVMGAVMCLGAVFPLMLPRFQGKNRRGTDGDDAVNKA